MVVRYVVAITGASGAIYGIRLLQELEGERILVMSKTAREIIPAETDYTVEQVEAMADQVFDDDQMFASIASGSFRYDAMFVAPCSESSVAKFANGIADTLISRAVSVCIKEDRKLILLVRETPKSAIMLENELKQLGTDAHKVEDGVEESLPLDEGVDIESILQNYKEEIGVNVEEFDLKDFEDVLKEMLLVRFIHVVEPLLNGLHCGGLGSYLHPNGIDKDGLG